MKIVYEAKFLLLSFLILLLSSESVIMQVDSIQFPVEWLISDLISEQHENIEILGNPKTYDTKYGLAVVFDGLKDAIFVDHSPLTNLTQFTIEVIMNPDSNGPTEQRFLHFGDINDERVLLETRLTKDNSWYIDAFIMSGNNKITLVNPDILHSLNEWYHIAFVVESGILEVFVNGMSELRGEIQFIPFAKGRTSIGVRLTIFTGLKEPYIKFVFLKINLHQIHS